MSTPNTNTVRIGGASGFWGDSSMGAPQLVQLGNVQYLVFDYLAELTMSIMAAQRMKNPEAGYALDFVAVTARQVLRDCKAKGIRMVSNAGGVNPSACAAALRAVAQELGVDVKIAVVEGDDVRHLTDALREAGTTEHTGALHQTQGRVMPQKLLTANAYLGAAPIKAALDAGADVVITGRCVDSAVTLGALMHHFQWGFEDLDQLAQGSLAGHIIECGAQGTGGLFTDWQDVPGWESIGYPVVEVSADGSFVATKPPHTGGLVTPAVIAEQLLYEIGDPARYMLPDVVCDFTEVRLEAVGEHQVRVSGARGVGVPSEYKVSATFQDGWRAVVQMAIIGTDAAAKAQRTGEALVARTQGMFKRLGLGNYSATRIDILGVESALGPHAAPALARTREAILRLAVRHPEKKALELFSREIAAPGTSFSPGTTGMDGGRPSVNPSICQFAFLLEKAQVQARVSLEGVGVEVPPQHRAQAAPARTTGTPLPTEIAAGGATEVPLLAAAHGRSGDKGDISNIGIVPRHPALMPLLRAQLTPEAVKAYLAFAVEGAVTRHELPGIGAFNFVCEQALGGGGMASLRHDPLGKGMAQILLTMPIQVPQHLVQYLKAL